MQDLVISLVAKLMPLVALAQVHADLKLLL